MGYTHASITLRNPCFPELFGNEALLGAVLMEDMDLLVCPKNQKLIVNPAHPNFAHSLVK